MEEPSTSHDVGWLYTEADATAGQGRVYLNSFAVQSTRTHNLNGFQGWATDGANVATDILPVATRMAPPVSMRMEAILGVWKDCNGDGYIGDARTGLVIYPPALLTGPTPCTGAPHVVGIGFWPVEEGDAPMIREFYPILQDKRRFQDKVALFDPDVRVWADFGLPGDPASTPCQDLPIPSSATRSTGGLIQYADCQVDFLVGRTLQEKAPALAWDDPYHPERDCDHPLNRDGLWESPHDCQPGPGPWESGTDQPAFTLWDCTQPNGTASIGIPFNGQYYEFFGVPTPRVSWNHLADGSYHDAFQDSLCMSSLHGQWSATVTHNTQIRSIERGGGGLFTHYLLTPSPLGEPGNPKATTDFSLSALFPRHTHLPHPRPVEDLAGPRWVSVETYAAPAYDGPFIRTSTLTPAPAFHTSTYARLSTNLLALFLVPNPQGTLYGHEACQGSPTGSAGGWNCNAEEWWTPPHAPRTEPKSMGVREGYYDAQDIPIGARVHDPYHLRDVDCHDGHVAAGLVYASLVQLGTEGTCP